MLSSSSDQWLICFSEANLSERTATSFSSVSFKMLEQRAHKVAKRLSPLGRAKPRWVQKVVRE
eukprot:6274314-Lingulodinium_polyedra.AAC.1